MISVRVKWKDRHRFGLDLVLFWSCCGFNLESILVLVWIWIRSTIYMCPNSVFRLSDELLVLESFWTCFGFRFGFGSNLDWDWRRLAPSLIWYYYGSRQCWVILQMDNKKTERSWLPYITPQPNFFWQNDFLSGWANLNMAIISGSIYPQYTYSYQFYHTNIRWLLCSRPLTTKSLWHYDSLFYLVKHVKVNFLTLIIQNEELQSLRSVFH